MVIPNFFSIFFSPWLFTMEWVAYIQSTQIFSNIFFLYSYLNKYFWKGKTKKEYRWTLISNWSEHTCIYFFYYMYGSRTSTFDSNLTGDRLLLKIYIWRRLIRMWCGLYISGICFFSFKYSISNFIIFIQHWSTRSLKTYLVFFITNNSFKFVNYMAINSRL